MKNKKIKMILFDIDFTLVFGLQTFAYYEQYPRMFEKTLARLLRINLEEAKKIADDHRLRFNGQEEKAFETHKLDLSHWHEAVSSFSVEALKPLPNIQKILSNFKNEGYSMGAITDGPKSQAEKILKAVEIDSNIFDVFIGWECGQKLPKGGRLDVFKDIIKTYSLQPKEFLMVGDSLVSDISPAYDCGMNVLYISLDRSSKYPTVDSIEFLPKYINFINK